MGQRKDVARTMFLHGAEELDNNFGARPYQNLAFSSLFGVVDALQRIVEDRCLDHVDGKPIGKLGWEGEILRSAGART
jgi:hypothetical protein